jgi:hypothetical protein
MGVIQPEKGVIHPQPRQDSLGNSGDPNARVAFAGENRDFLRENIAPEANSLQKPCLMASSSLGSPCTRSWDRSNRTYGSFELSDDSFLQMSWNPSNDWAVLVPFGELYALTHTIQRIDAHASRGSRESVRSDSCLESGPPKVTCAV